MNFVAIDFETANRNRSSICSVGLAFVENGRLVGSEHIYVKPTPNHYESINVSVHGITDADTRNRPTFGQQWASIKRYFHNQTVVAHNAAFDCSALRSTLDSASIAYPDLNYHCTWRMSQAMLPLANHKLSDVSAHFKIKLTHHNAESDARAAALIALHLCHKHKFDSLDKLSASIGYKVGKIVRATKTYSPYSKR